MTAQQGEGRGRNNDNVNPLPTHNGSIVDRFFEIIKNKAAAASKDATFKDAWGGSNADYAVEDLIIEQHTRPFVWGVGSALITFASFRLSKSSMVRPGGALHNLFGRSSGSTKKIHVPPSRIGGGHTTTSTDREALNKALSIPFDFVLSLLIGGSATIFLFDKDRAMQDMAEVPLVEGRSLVSDTLCNDFILEHEKFPNEFWVRDHSDFPSLDAIHSFVLNCQKRDSYENVLRKVRGTPAADPVVIPSPGVPPVVDYIFEDESDDETGNILEEDSFGISK